MIRKGHLQRLYDAANMQRWNDKIRPVDLRELDKQAHKMVVAYVLGKIEEEEGSGDFDWIQVIEGGIFEFLQRVVITDLKPQLFHEIKKKKADYRALNNYVFEHIKDDLRPISERFLRKFERFLKRRTSNVNHQILSAAHYYASQWEFEIIERSNPGGYEIIETRNHLRKELKKYDNLKGMVKLCLHANLRDFVDLCGQLRFQIRWGQVGHRVPRTAVLGHMLLVAMLSYLFSLEINACKNRCVNNYFAGLFHDLPEVLTRDVINPIKQVGGLSTLIAQYEQKEMTKVYNLLPESWHKEMRLFTEKDSESSVEIDGNRIATTSDEINRLYNRDEYKPKDGEIVKRVDYLNTFVEAHLALESGVNSHHLTDGKQKMREQLEGRTVGGINFGQIYNDFR